MGDEEEEEEEYEWDDFSEDASAVRSSTRISRVSEIYPEFVSRLQDERAKRAAAEEEEKKERLRQLLGLDKTKISDSAETLLTPEEAAPSVSTSSSESSGNLCLQDITVSDSRLKLLDIYNDYPIPEDPGLVLSFWMLFPKPAVYKEDGVQRFHDVCKKLGIRPIAKICDMLGGDDVDLSYYGVDPRAVRAICEAVENNTSVQSLSLQDNWLSVDACFHLNNLLSVNEILTSLNLSGCQIGPRGAKRLINGLGKAPALEYANLSKCNLQDEGAGYVCDGLCDSQTIRILDLSDNDLKGDCAWSFYYLLAQSETLEELNLSWNLMKSQEFWKTFVQGMTKSVLLTKLDLSWNSLGNDCLPFLTELIEKSWVLTELDLSNNRFEAADVQKIASALSKNSRLETLSLGSNPISPEAVHLLIKSLTPENAPFSQLRHLNLDNIWTNKEVVPFLEEIKRARPLLTVKLGGILSNYKLVGPDARKIFLKRANFEAMKPKKKKQRKNFGHFVLGLEDGVVTRDEFVVAVKKFKVKLSESLVTEIMNCFQGDKDQVDQTELKRVYLKEYPETEPPPPKPKKEKKKKDKKKKKGEGGEVVEEAEKVTKKKVRMVAPEEK